MNNDSLSNEQMQHFIEYGFVHLTDCFDKDFAQQWTDAAFPRLGYDKDDSSTWEKPIIHMPSEDWVQVKDFAPKAYSAICQLLGGEDRIQRKSALGQRLHRQLLARRRPRMDSALARIGRLAQRR